MKNTWTINDKEVPVGATSVRIIGTEGCVEAGSAIHIDIRELVRLRNRLQGCDLKTNADPG